MDLSLSYKKDFLTLLFILTLVEHQSKLLTLKLQCVI